MNAERSYGTGHDTAAVFHFALAGEKWNWPVSGDDSVRAFRELLLRAQIGFTVSGAPTPDGEQSRVNGEGAGFLTRPASSSRPADLPVAAPADPVVSPADTPEAAIRAALGVIAHECSYSHEAVNRYKLVVAVSDAAVAVDEWVAVGERDRQHIARQAAVLKDLCGWAEGLTIADCGARLMAIVDDAAAVLADKEVMSDVPSERSRYVVDKALYGTPADLPVAAPAKEDEMPENDEARDALTEAMFKAGYSDPNSDGVDREWMSRGQYESGYRAEIVLGLLRDAGFDVVKVDA